MAWVAISVGALAATSGRAAARDWMEPPEVFNPLLEISEPGVETDSYGKLEYNAQPFLDSRDDVFQINALSAFRVASLWDPGRTLQGWGLSAAYGTYLMSGSVQPGDTPGSRLQWMMNAVQMEYGLFLAFRVRGVDLLLEYSRTSQHPLRDRYSEVSSDLIRTGVMDRARFASGLEVRAALRAGYSDLFDFWQSRIPNPRTRFLLTPALWVDYPLTTLALGRLDGTLKALAEGYLDVVFLREGGTGANAGFRAGLSAVLGGLRCDLYVDGYASDDTEIREDRHTPVRLLGWGLRLRSAS